MKKIMFNDRFGLTDAVLEGRKTVTRRIITPQPTYSKLSGINWKGYAYGIGFSNPEDAYRNFITGTEYSKSCNRYRVGEVVAIAQRMIDICSGSDLDMRYLENKYGAAWNNKMFVKADLMPHQLEILGGRVERLQDITDEDCIKEGITEIAPQYGHDYWYDFPNSIKAFDNPRKAFAYLIDKISGKGTWDSNPYVFRCEFKKLK